MARTTSSERPSSICARCSALDLALAAIMWEMAAAAEVMNASAGDAAMLPMMKLTGGGDDSCSSRSFLGVPRKERFSVPCAHGL